MIEKIESALAEISHKYGDRRLHYCRVEVSALEGKQCTLDGAVLDRKTLTDVTEALTAQFPSLTFHGDEIRVLRQQPPPLLTVSTNVTGLHGEPSFGSECLSQLLGGWRVEKLLEEEKWAFVRQTDGYLGWAHLPYLSGKPAPEPDHLVAEPVALVRERPAADAALAGRILAGTSVAVQTVDGQWAGVSGVAARSGWLPLSALRPLDELPSTEAAKRQQMVRDSLRYVGVPYQWGGITALGLDCSGFVQLLHGLAGVTIPRDADMQFADGQPLQPPFQAGDLLFFGSERGHRAISHVGLSLGNWRIIHASRPRNGVHVDDVQEASWLSDIYVGARRFV
jgi:cell wall-associated NlpC family hydrolase